MTAEVKVRVDTSGPLFDGTTRETVIHWLDELKQDVANEAEDHLHGFVMDKTGRARGEYQAHITDRRTLSGYNDVIVFNEYPTSVYGPWLEGFSERNRSTRFKGYHLWRKTKQWLQGKTDEMIQEKAPELTHELGG